MSGYFCAVVLVSRKVYVHGYFYLLCMITKLQHLTYVVGKKLQVNKCLQVLKVSIPNSPLTQAAS